LMLHHNYLTINSISWGLPVIRIRRESSNMLSSWNEQK